FFLIIIFSIKVWNPSERLCISPGVDLRIIPDDPDLSWIPCMRHKKMIIIAPEMSVFKKKSFHVFVVEELFASIFYNRQIFFMNYFIALNVKQPIAGACVFCNVCLMSIFLAIWVFFQVPGCTDYFNFI